MKRFFFLILAIMLVFSLALPASATQQVQPRFAHIMVLDYNLTIKESSNTAECDASCVTYDDMEVQIECKLQRYNNSKWNTVKTWTDSGYGYASIYENWAVPAGYNYRIYVTYKVYDSNGDCVETVTRSDSGYLPTP